MKREILLTALLLILSSSLYARETAAFNQNKTVYDIQVSESAYLPYDINSEIFKTQLIASANLDFTDLSAGVQYSPKRQDASVSFTIFPEQFINYKADFFKIHFYQLLHMRHFAFVSIQYDILPCADFIFTLSGSSLLSLKLGYLFKFADIKSYEAQNIILCDRELEIALLYEKRFGNNFALHTGISSFDFFTMNKFFTPCFNLGMEYEFTENIYAKLDLNFRYDDFFTLSGYLESFEIKMTAGVRL